MTIVVFYHVSSKFERHSFDFMDDIEAFETLYRNMREKLDSDAIRMYDMESFQGDPAYPDLSKYGIAIGDEFEVDFNDELYDNGYWTKVLHLPSDNVIDIIESVNTKLGYDMSNFKKGIENV